VATDFVSADTRVYAQWTKQKPVVDAKQFNVTVSTNGGTIADGDHKGEAGDIQVSAAQDSVLVNALPQVQRDGYLFAGWSYDKDGKSPVVATDFVSADTRVYAQWTKADDSKKDDSKPADTTKKNDTKSNTKKTVAQKIKKAVLGNTGATVGGVAAFAVLALLGFAGITVLRKRA
ncbi:InlB B-repeat-containing protein, partial [Bifidobacterium hominis]|uniref:InlB B-repeat-containing protein n=1 Tax=Bifidobacterium hominis TaxID=3133177 RepID=UPI003D0803C5